MVQVERVETMVLRAREEQEVRVERVAGKQALAMMLEMLEAEPAGMVELEETLG